MAQDEVTRIQQIFLQFSLHPIYLEHEEVITSEDAAKTRGFELKQGIKSLLFTNRNDAWVIVDVPADQKVDSRKVADIMGWGKIRMASPEEVLLKTGCMLGAVPPFGHRHHIPILVDTKVYDNQHSAFNIGLRSHSVKIPTAEVRVVFKHIGAIEGDFIKVSSGLTQ